MKKAGISIIAVFILLTAAELFARHVNFEPNQSEATQRHVFFGGYAVNATWDLTTFEQSAGKAVAISGEGSSWWYNTFSWGDFNSTLKDRADHAVSHGSIPLFLWNIFNPLRADGSQIPANTDEYYQRLRDYAPKQITSGRYDQYIHTWAQQIKAWGHPIMIRTMHELNSNIAINNPGMPYGFAWAASLTDVNGQQITSPQDVIDAWRHIVGIFRSDGATNVTWVWSVLSWPSQAYGGNNLVTLASIYPGDSYVDWIGMECYNFFTNSRWETCDGTNVSGAYREVAALSPTKPLMIAEMGSVEDPADPAHKSEWIRNALDPSRSSAIVNLYPRIAGILYWDDPRGNSLAIESSQAATQAFRESIASTVYTSNIYGSYAHSPVEVPDLISAASGGSTVTPSSVPTNTVTPTPTPSQTSTALLVRLSPRVTCGLVPGQIISVSWTVSTGQPAAGDRIAIWPLSYDASQWTGIPAAEKSSVMVTASPASLTIPTAGGPLYQLAYFTAGDSMIAGSYVSITTHQCAVSTATPSAAFRPADLNKSGHVDIFDYNLLISHFGQTGTGLVGDIDGNGRVDIFDYNTLVGNFAR